MPVETLTRPDTQPVDKPAEPEKKTIMHADDERPKEKPLGLPFLAPLIDTFRKLEGLEENNPEKEELQDFLLKEASKYSLHIVSEPWYRQRRIRKELNILQNVQPRIYNTTINYLSKINTIVATESERLHPRRKRTIWRRTHKTAKRLGLPTP